MDTKFQTSFIPKKSIAQSISRSRPEAVSVALVVSIIIFILTLAAAGGVFAYKRILVARINDMTDRLSQAKNSFEPASIEKWSRLDKRLQAATKVIAAHTVVSPIFDLLENDTLATVKFDSFSFNLKDGGAASLAMAGQAKNFSAVALQSDVLGQEKYIKNPVFSDLNPDQSGNVLFKFASSIDPAMLFYSSALTPPAASGR